MPYIPRLRREELDTLFNKSFDEYVESPGELNYLLTKLCLLYKEQHNLSYQTISEIVSGLECAKLEFYRKVAAPYEDDKASINGDVY